MDIFIKTNEYSVITEYTRYNIDDFQKITLPTNLLETNLIGWQFKNGVFIKPLQVLKEEKIKSLTNDFNTAKKITIKNGNSLEINHDTKERDILLKIIEEVNNIQEVSLGAYIYTQQDANMGFRIMPEIAKYIFKDMFVATLSNGTNVNSRVHNRAVIFENSKHRIEKANSINELNIINWSFINPNGIIVDINKKANQILTDGSTTQEAKNVIKLLKNENGEIHLIKPISELE